jgi:flagellar protein FliS
MSSRAASLYKRVDLESAPKTVVLARLFERFDRDTREARRAIVARDIHAKAAAIDHAVAIVIELRAGLDHAAAPELCANLDALYDFVIRLVSEASSSLATAPLDHAARIMAELAAAFQQAHATGTP